MKNSIFLLMLFLLLSSCTVEEKTRVHFLNFNNSSTEQVFVDGYLEGELKYSEIIAAGQNGMKYTLQINTFGNFGAICDSLSIKFQNNRGYLCSLQNTTYCFTTKPSPLTAPESDFIVEGNVFTYTITQEDQVTAFELD